MTSVYSRALQRAAELLGGRDTLAKLLQIPAAEIDKWIADQGKPPREVFLRIVDLILDETAPPPAAAGEPPDAAAPRDAAGASGKYSD